MGVPPQDRQVPTIRIEQFGQEREPVVVIDNFSGRADDLARIGRSASYRPQSVYPGLRSPADGAYLMPMYSMLSDILARAFGLSGANVEACDYSIVSVAPDRLTSAQRIPHYDDTSPFVIALLHFTQAAEWGGTAFFRHRRTGFETIQSERIEAYAAAISEDDREFGPPDTGYACGNSRRFEQIGAIESKPDRAILYRGRTLHSGIIPKVPDPLDVVRSGRLTINTFLVGWT